MFASPDLPEVSKPLSLISDLEYLREVVLANETGITSAQLTEFSQIIADSEEPQDADALSLIAFQALAALENAHTTVLSPKMYRLPVRFHWTKDALVIVKALPEYAHLLGHRVVSLGGKTPEQMLTDISSVVGGGTASWHKYRSEFFFSAPSALELFGATVVNGSVEMSTEDLSGNINKIQLSKSEALMSGDPFWDFLDAFPDNQSFNTKEWTTLLSEEDPLPLYLQNAKTLFFVSPLVEANAVYLRMNASFDTREESVAQFEQRVLNTINEHAAQFFIVDFRFNRGGDYTKVLPLVESLSRRLPENGHLYVLTGPNTFSAGLIAATQFKRYIPNQLTVVGQEVGDTLKFKAEGFYPELPYSGISVYLTTAWSDVAKGCSWFDDCWFLSKVMLKGVGTFDIDIPARNSWRDYVNHQDALLRAVLTDINNTNIN